MPEGKPSGILAVRIGRIFLTAVLALAPSTVQAELPEWDLNAFDAPPKVVPTETAEPGVKAIYYENIPWKGQPTQVFAYYGLPAETNGQKVPAVVLVHGGLGTAYAEWVRYWNRLGYAAIAMDHCGNQPTVAAPEQPYSVGRPRNPQGGPTGDGGFGQVDEPLADQWPYQAVAAIIRAHSFLRSLPEVDPNRIGLTGISWGGYLACLTAGVDDRFRFVVPVYGCGFIGDDPTWPPAFHQLSPAQQQRWTSLWDPSHFLPRARMPMLWINGTNDPAFPLSAWNKSTLLPQGPQERSLSTTLTHGQKQGAEIPEISAFAAQILERGTPLPSVGPLQSTATRASASFQASTKIQNAHVLFTRDRGPWKDRRWETLPAQVSGRQIRTDIPENSTAFFFNLTDDRTLTVSSALHERP